MAPPLEMPLGDFLTVFHGERHSSLVAIKKGTREIKFEDFANGEDRGRKAQAWAEGWNAAGFEIYFSINPLKAPLGRKAKKSDILESRWVWIECDPPDELRGSALDLWRADKLSELRAARSDAPLPSLLLNSGRGLWAFWKLREPQPLDGYGPQTERVEAHGRGLERLFGADECRNVDRIARLPGFVNHKTGATARVLEFHPERQRDLDALPSVAITRGSATDLIDEELRDLVDDEAAREAATEYLRDKAPLAIEGQKGRKTTMSVLQRCQDFGCRFDTAILLMEDYWNDRCAPPWDPGEIAHTMRGLTRTDFIGRDHPKAVERRTSKHAEFWFEKLGGPPAGASKIFKSVGAFCSEFIPPSFAIESIVRSASLYTLTAKTGAGKTAFNVVAALAVATGRKDILGREVACGRVAYLACENPDDIRMRIMIAAFKLGIDIAELGDRIVVLDRREKPELVALELASLATAGPFALIIVDTLAGIFDGDNINDNVEGGDFMRRLRPLTVIEGRPSVVVSAHPVKHAGEASLIPYGGGAILNEVDGNLTLWKDGESAVVRLHWQGKFRGAEFEPILFRFEISNSPNILDAKGQLLQLPTLRPTSEENAEDRQKSGHAADAALLRAMIDSPSASIRDLGAAIGCAKSAIERKLSRLTREKLVKNVLGKWNITEAGRKAVREKPATLSG